MKTDIHQCTLSCVWAVVRCEIKWFCDNRDVDMRSCHLSFGNISLDITYLQCVNMVFKVVIVIKILKISRFREEGKQLRFGMLSRLIVSVVTKLSRDHLCVKKRDFILFLFFLSVSLKGEQNLINKKVIIKERKWIGNFICIYWSNSMNKSKVFILIQEYFKCTWNKYVMEWIMKHLFFTTLIVW